MMLSLALLFGSLVFRPSDAGKSCMRRRLASGKMLKIDSVCEAVTTLVREETRDNLLALFTKHSRENQHKYLMETSEEVVQLCKEKLPELEAQQCQFYLKLLPLIDERDSVLEASWLGAFGDDKDNQNACSRIVNAVNDKLAELSDDPDSPIKLDEEGLVSFESDPSTWVESAMNKGLEQVSVALFKGRRRLLQLHEDLSCTVVGGVAAGIASGAALVGVALGSLCRSFGARGVCQTLDYVPL